PAVELLVFAEIPVELRVALEHAIVGVGNAQRVHHRRQLRDPVGDVKYLLAHSLLTEIMHLGIPARPLTAESAGKRTAAIGFDDRSELAIEELIQNASSPRRRDGVDFLMSVPGRGTRDTAVRPAVERRRNFAAAQFRDGLAAVQ